MSEQSDNIKTLADEKSVYAVVDGKQRLETIILFYKNKRALDDYANDSYLSSYFISNNLVFQRSRYPLE